MDFALSEDQLALAAAVGDLIAAHAGTDVVRSCVDDPGGDGDPPGLWQRMAEQGWAAVLVPEEFDGLGLGLLDAAVIARRLGSGVVPSAFVPSLLGGEAIRLAGSDEQRKQWLPRLAAGDARLTAVLPDPAAETAATGVSAAGASLTGEARFVEYAHLADRVVVATDDGGLWLVDPAGVTLTRTPVLDGTARPATLTFDATPAEQLPGGSPAVVAGLALRAAALQANDLAGIAREAITRTVDYVKTREQFGKVVGSFQALKHGLADLAVEVQMAEHAAWYAAHALDADLPDAALAVSIAKAKASDAARHATAKMIQYHGGIGFTWEHEAHLYFKRAKRGEFAYGDAAAHREKIARLVVDRS